MKTEVLKVPAQPELEVSYSDVQVDRSAKPPEMLHLAGGEAEK